VTTLRIRCLWHEEQTPSLLIRLENGRPVYGHCLGCGKTLSAEEMTEAYLAPIATARNRVGA
jgi:DNA primase